MKKYETNMVTRDENRCVEVACDVCGAQAPHPGGIYPWASDGMFDVTDTEVRLTTGYHYPEGGSGAEVSVDLCPTCFRTKLVPWLESLGATVTENDLEW